MVRPKKAGIKPVSPAIVGDGYPLSHGGGDFKESGFCTHKMFVKEAWLLG